MQQESEIKKKAEYLYPRILEALSNTKRRNLLEFLAKHPQEKLDFYQIQVALSIIPKAALLNHLTVLQMADLVERIVELEKRRKNSDPYYAFYQITSLGEYVNRMCREMAEGIMEVIQKIK